MESDQDKKPTLMEVQPQSSVMTECPPANILPGQVASTQPRLFRGSVLRPVCLPSAPKSQPKTMPMKKPEQAPPPELESEEEEEESDDPINNPQDSDLDSNKPTACQNRMDTMCDCNRAIKRRH